jgi:hypothetical protein
MAIENTGPTLQPIISETFDSSCMKAAVECVNIVVSKQTKYGKQNILDFGEFGILVRMNDKFNRLKNMVVNNIEDSVEPIDDTINDIIGYALLWKMVRNGTFKLPMKSAEIHYTIVSPDTTKGYK